MTTHSLAEKFSAAARCTYKRIALDRDAPPPGKGKTKKTQREHQKNRGKHENKGQPKENKKHKGKQEKQNKAKNKKSKGKQEAKR